MQWRHAAVKPPGTAKPDGEIVDLVFRRVRELVKDSKEPRDEIVARIDQSIRVTEVYYSLVGGAFPYTVCGFLDTCTIDRPGHDLHPLDYRMKDHPPLRHSSRSGLARPIGPLARPAGGYAVRGNRRTRPSAAGHLYVTLSRCVTVNPMMSSRLIFVAA